MASWQPLQIYSGWFTAYIILWMGFLVALSIYETRTQRLGVRILDAVAVLCLGYTFGQAAAFHIGVQADQWAMVSLGVSAVFAVLLMPYVLIQRRHQSREEVAAAKARLRAKAIHERRHVGADAVRYLECEFCRRELNEYTDLRR